MGIFAQTTQWKDMYKVKKRDTVFSIAKDNGLTVEELIAANPDMKMQGYELKKGDYIFIPYPKNTSTGEVARSNTPRSTASTTETTSRMGERRFAERINVGVMLPLHDMDGDGKRMVEYYRGMLLAFNQLKETGLDINVYAWNVGADADIRQTLLDDNAKKCDVIFGPLYSKQVKYLGDFCQRNGIKMVIPFSISGNETAKNPQIYQVYQAPQEINEATIRHFVERFQGFHPVFIDCNDTTSRKGNFTFGLRKQLEAKGISYNITNLNSSENIFLKSFSRTQPNIVILNTGRSPELTVSLTKLDGIRTLVPGIKISLFGYTEWLMYTNHNLENFFKYDTYIPTTFYYNPLSEDTKLIEQRYRWSFHADMLNALPRFAIVGYDQAMYFMKGLQQYGNGFIGTKTQTVGNSIQTPYHFVKAGSGGYLNKSFMLVHYKPNRSIETINY